MTEVVAAIPEQDRNVHELTPADLYLKELRAVARYWGGEEYAQGLGDGVEIARGLRLRGEASTTRVQFMANRIRNSECSKRLYTIYTLQLEVSRQVTAEQLPTHVIESAKFYFQPEDLCDPEMTIEEKHLVRYTIDDDTKDLDYELEVSYTMDGQEVYSLSTEDAKYDSEAADEDDDGEPGGGVALLPRPVAEAGHEPDDMEEVVNGKPDMSPEATLLNELWALIESEKGNLAATEITFDPEALKKMANIQEQLEKENVRHWRLLSLARCELQEQQIERCRRILQKFSPGKPHSAMI